MGRVYSAVHLVTRRRCALKILPDALSQNADFVTRFHAEAQTLAKLNHPNIVQIYSGGESQSRFFLEMELIEGGDLQKRVQDHAATGGLPEAEAERVLDGILAALDYAHGQGVIHRDLKPANILLTKSGEVKVSDFGLATVVGEDLHRSRLEMNMRTISLAQVASLETVVVSSPSATGGFAGTILYMSPQALRSEPPDPRDDLFSLGVVAYYMLAGKTPAVNYTPVSRLRKDLKGRWDEFIGTCLAEERADRFRDAAAARAALRRRPGRPAWHLAALLAGVGVAVSAGLFAFSRYSSDGQGSPLLSHVISRGEPQTLTFEAVADRPSNAPPFALLAQSTSGLPVEFMLVSGPAIVAGNVVTITGPGLVTVRASQPGDGRFEAAPPVERTFRVIEPSSTLQRKEQRIAFEPVSDRMVGDQPFEIFASSSSGLPIALSVVSGPATLRGNVVTVTGVGTVVLRCDQPGDASFAPAESLERTFNVRDPIPESLTLTLPGGVVMNFVRIPPGRAILGSPPNEVGRKSDEVQREFSRNHGFLLGQTEVTQAQYLALTGQRPSYTRHEWQLRPVEQLLFREIAVSGKVGEDGFFPRLNRYLKEHHQGEWEAVLPSEDEWEYACRAGSTGPFPSVSDGDPFPRENSVAPYAVFARSEVAPVASKSPNAFGLYDMHGNVAEWTREGTLRGGSFRDALTSLRAAARQRGMEDSSIRDRRFGFRVMLRRVELKSP